MTNWDHKYPFACNVSEHGHSPGGTPRYVVTITLFERVIHTDRITTNAGPGRAKGIVLDAFTARLTNALYPKETP